jgi:tetratricopeptide (TPR) repeat protein
MNWLKNLFSGSENKTEKNSKSSVSKPSQPELTEPNKVRIFEKNQEGELQETAGNEAMVGPLMDLALSKYNSVMSASRRNSISYSDEKDLDECIGYLTKVIELWPRYGEPFGLRGNMYFIRGQINRNKNDLEKAIKDFERGVKIGAKDISNHAVWKSTINQVNMVKNMF